jgi:hypothetical protein
MISTESVHELYGCLRWYAPPKKTLIREVSTSQEPLLDEETFDVSEEKEAAWF